MLAGNDDSRHGGGAMRFLLILAMVLAAHAAAAQTRTVEIIDSQGFERPYTAYTIEVPRDWAVSGEVLWRKPCSGNDLYELVISASAPDGRTGFRIMPGHQIIWTDAVLHGLDPYTDQLMRAQIEADRNRLRTQFQGSNCHVARIDDPRQLFRTLVLAKRPPGTRETGRQPDTTLMQAFAATLGPSQPGLETAYDAFVADLAYPMGGGTVIEHVGFSWYMFRTELRDPTMYSLSQHYVVNSLQLSWVAQERQAADEAILKHVAQSFRPDPAWQAKVQEVQRKLAEQRRSETAENARQREQDRLRREQANDQQHQQFLQYLRE